MIRPVVLASGDVVDCAFGFNENTSHRDTRKGFLKAKKEAMLKIK